MRGYDGGKKVNGRKRHLLVDTQGLVMEALVSPANVHDKEGALSLLDPFALAKRFPRMAKVWVDKAYAGLVDWARESLGWDMEVVKGGWTDIDLKRVFLPPGMKLPQIPKGFQVLPRRWVVERTFAWLGRNRRLAKDYEYLTTTGEALIYASMVRLMLRRLAKPG